MSFQVKAYSRLQRPVTPGRSAEDKLINDRVRAIEHFLLSISLEYQLGRVFGGISANKKERVFLFFFVDEDRQLMVIRLGVIESARFADHLGKHDTDERKSFLPKLLMALEIRGELKRIATKNNHDDQTKTREHHADHNIGEGKGFETGC